MEKGEFESFGVQVEALIKGHKLIGDSTEPHVEGAANKGKTESEGHSLHIASEAREAVPFA